MLNIYPKYTLHDHKLQPVNKYIKTMSLVWSSLLQISHTNAFEGVTSSEEGEPIISSPDPTTYSQEICTVPKHPDPERISDMSSENV